MVFALTIGLVLVSVISTISVIWVTHFVTARAVEVHEAVFEYLAQTQVIGGQPVELARKHQEHVHEETRAKRERARPLPRPEDIVGN